jgi:hypothetical protein
MFRYKLKAIEAHKAWMKSPEVLEHCSTGLCFPSSSVDNAQVNPGFFYPYFFVVGTLVIHV